MSITGERDGPPYRLGVAITDIVSGLFAAQGVLAALVARERRPGAGSRSTSACSMRRPRCSPIRPATYFATGEVPARMGNRHPTIVPYESFETADGELVIAGGNDDIWRRLCGALDLDGPRRRSAVSDQQGSRRALRRAAPDARRALKTRTRAEWVERLADAGVPCGSVREISEVLADPQIAARDMVAEVRSPDGRPRPE